MSKIMFFAKAMALLGFCLCVEPQVSYGFPPGEWCRMGGNDPSTPSPCVRAGSNCDNSGERDLYLPPYDPANPMKIRVKFIVFGDTTSDEKLTAQVARLNLDFENYGIKFEESGPRIFEENARFQFLCGTCPLPDNPDNPCCFQSKYECRGTCDGVTPCIATEESAMKAVYPAPGNHLRVYVVDNTGMNLGGLSYFPSCADAAGTPGGIIMHGPFVGGSTCGIPPINNCKELTHEIGHALGLWHTHHGVSEVPACSPCYEFVNGYQCNARGDLCYDTAPTPYNASCGEPGGTDCLGDSFGNTDEKNHMALPPVGCPDHFTSQQAGRMHCWTCNATSAVSNWIISGDCNNNGTKDVCDINRGTSCDGDPDGIPDECQPPDFGNGACCLSHAPGDCIRTTRCVCDQQGIWFNGVGSKCGLVNCVIVPDNLQGPPNSDD